MNKALIFLPLIILSTRTTAQKMTRDDYIRTYYHMAIIEMQKYKIPASITMAQGILESSNGNSYLATKAKNHFGIKCHDWKGPSVKKHDDVRNECFRKYDNVLHSYEDHSKFLSTRSRYAFLFDYKPTDYKAWAKGLRKARYATDPKYPAKLIRIIEESELYRLDEYALAKNPQTALLPSILHKNHTIAESPVSDKKENAEQTIHTTENKLSYLMAQEGVPLESIARKCKLHLWELQKFNDLEVSTKIMKPGQRIYIERKAAKIKKGKQTHTVTSGETMWEIAQKYGIRLKSLYKINKMNKGELPQAGSIIFLNKKARVKT